MFLRVRNKARLFNPWLLSNTVLESPAAAAAAAKSLQPCPTLCDAINGSPPGSPVPGILQARTLEWVAISFSNALKWKVKVKLLSCVWLLETPWTAAHQAPPSMGFSEKAMATHSSTLAWKIPWMEEPGRLQSMGSLSWTWLSNFTFTFHFHALEKEMATHSGVLAWRLPGTSMGSHRVGCYWSDLAAAAAAGWSQLQVSF